MPLSPLCLVSDNGGPFIPTTGGVDVHANDPMQIQLQSPSGVGTWYLFILGTDELTSPPTLTNVNPGTGQVTSPTSIVSFTYPGLPLGRAILFQSVVVSGSNTAQTTFTIYTKTLNGDRVGAVGETREGNVSFGWSALLNPILRQGAGYLFYDDTIQTPATGSNNIQGALDYLKTHGSGGGVSLENNGTPIAGNPHSTLNLVGITAADNGGGSATLTTTPGVNVENNGTPVANNPHTTINLIGITGADAGGGVVSFTAQPGLNFEQNGVPIANNPHTAANFTGAGVSVADAGGGVAAVAISSVAGPLVGDNSDSRRMGPERNFLVGMQVNLISAPQPLLTTTLKDGSGYAGADLVLSERRLLMTGSITYGAANTTMPSLSSFTPPTIGGGFNNCSVVSSAGFPIGGVVMLTQTTPPLSGTFLIGAIPDGLTLDLYTLSVSGPGNFTGDGGTTVAYAGSTLDGQLVSMETGGFQYGLDFSFPALATHFTNSNQNNPTALIGLSVPNNYFNPVSIFKGGAVSNYIYESIHSTGNDYNIIWDAAAEDWTGARACYVLQDATFNHGSTAEVYWTAPLANKVYQGNIFFNKGDPTFQSFPGETPTGICATGANTFWVSFVGSGKLRQYQVVPSGAYPHASVPTFVQVGVDVTLANVVELLFDGKYLWAAATTGTFGTIYKLDSLGNLLDSYTVNSGTGGVSARTRMCFDGLSVWITLGAGGVMRIFVEGGEGSINESFLLSVGLGQEARGICADRDGTVYVAVYSGTNLLVQAFFPTTGSFPDVRRPRPIVWQLGTFTMPATFNAIQVPPQSTTGGSMRLFDLDIVATSGFGGNAAWKKSFAVFDNGITMALQGTAADVIPPRINATAVTQGWNVTVTDGASLIVQLTTGTFTSDSIWTLNLTETHSYGGSL